jgi:hypothetical protein
MLFSGRIHQNPLVCFADITTHNHYTISTQRRVFKDTAPIFAVESEPRTRLVVALLNSSAALFWLKQVCFNKGSGKNRRRTVSSI